MGTPIHFYSHMALINGALVERIESGIVIDRIAINGGRETAHLVATSEGSRVVRSVDVRSAR